MNFLIIVFSCILYTGIAFADNLIFFDDFDKDDFSTKWITGSTGGPNSITKVNNRIQVKEYGNCLETINTFNGNIRVEVDIEKIGNFNYGMWDINIELPNNVEGGIRFDYNGIDAIYLAEGFTAGNFFDATNPNKGKLILCYSNQYVRLSFANQNGKELVISGLKAVSHNEGKVKIWIAGHEDSPRYVDSVKIYTCDDTDRDGVPDQFDKCPNIKAESAYFDGCPENFNDKDSDSDGVIDKWDSCSQTHENSCVNNKGCSCDVSIINENSSVGEKKWKTYYANIDNTYTNFSAKIQNLSNDVDLYVKKGNKPDFNNYDCRPYKGGRRDESCDLNNNGDNLWYFSVYGYKSGDFSISVTAKR